ncbi:MAG TPA: hypothetical protein VG710_07105 [Opitutus sp.]|nr:hypothetical protein [Opitutus sp.]
MKRSPEEFEKFIHQTLRSVPDRRAPRSLEARVLAAIAARAALPWWKQSFAQWPLAARGGFLVLCGGLVKVALMVAVWAMGDFEAARFTDAFSTQFAWIERADAVVRGIGGFFALLWHSIPPLWLYGGLACLASLYLTLFGLSAAAYKTLYANQSSSAR